MGRANADRLLEIQTREIQVEIFMLCVIDFVDHEHDGRFGFAQHLRQILIDRREAMLRIDHEKNEIALVHRRIGCGPNLRG